MERLTIPDVRIDKNTIRRTIIDAEKVKECAMELYGRLKKLEDVVADAESEDYDLDRLRELVQADRDGRCAVVTLCCECKNHREVDGQHYCKFWRMYCPDDSDFYCKAAKSALKGEQDA